MARSPLFRLFSRALHLATQANRQQMPVDELPELYRHQRQLRRSKLRRRKFLKIMGAFGGGTMLAVGCKHSSSNAFTQKGTDAKIAIVGAGLAGLNAAYQLKKAGYRATIYEATNRTGGRMSTLKDVVGKGIWTNQGAEFINSDHEDMRSLAQEFKIPLLDRFVSEETALNDLYYFDGRTISESELAEAFLPIARLIAADAERLNEDWDNVSVELDALSIAEYCDRFGISGWLRKFVEVALISEMGLEPEELSAMNLIGFFDGDGNADERFLVQNGTQAITDAIARELQDQIEIEMPLESLRDRGDGYTLTFNGTNIDADLVIIAIPFSVLRQIDLDLTLPDKLERFIRQVGYGNNVKVTTGFTRQPWRERGLSGRGTSDLPLQVFWDATQLQPVETGALTFYLGGNTGLNSDRDSDRKNAEMYVKMLAPVIPNLQETWNEKTSRLHWPSYPYARGSYACMQPGQYTGFVLDYLYLEGDKTQECADGNLIFAGEHTSDEYQGYMNGAAQSGRLAAQAVLKRLKAF
ncbi:MAG: FAD-dependent oxidoreductase [Cyanobacteria bacterium SBLK]|nr:FAD-dependent oxidoreductase [Cyanobacteria bacterium SBLK]